MTSISSVSVNLPPEMALVACTIPLFSWHEEMSPRPPLNNRYQFCPLCVKMRGWKRKERFLLASLVGLRGTSYYVFGNCINFHGHPRPVYIEVCMHACLSNHSVVQMTPKRECFMETAGILKENLHHPSIYAQCSSPREPSSRLCNTSGQCQNIIHGGGGGKDKDSHCQEEK